MCGRQGLLQPDVEIELTEGPGGSHRPMPVMKRHLGRYPGMSSRIEASHSSKSA